MAESIGIQAFSFFSSDAIFAFGRAAELAFADERLVEGHKICRELLSHELAAPKTPRQFAFYATIGALLGEFEVYLTPQGAVMRRNDEVIGSINWPQNSSVEAAQLIQLLLPASAASGPIRKTVGPLLVQPDKERLNPAVLETVVASREFQIILALNAQQAVSSPNLPSEFREQFYSQEELYLRVFENFSVLESDYSMRINKLRSDVYYWNTLRPRGSIVDWPLLALWVAADKSQLAASSLERARPFNAEAAFIRFLAKSVHTPIINMGLS